MGFRDSLSGGVRLVRAVPSPIGFCQFGAVQLHPEAGCSGRRRERRSVCLWRRRRAPRRPLWLTAGSAGRGMNGVSGAFVKTRDENSYFTPIAWVRPCNSLSECGFSCPEGRNGGRIVQKGDARLTGGGRRRVRASEGAGVVSGRPETPGGTRRAGPLRRCGSSRPRGWIRAGSGRSASRRRARRSCPWRRRRGDRRRARRARASRRASSCRARRRTFRRT